MQMVNAWFPAGRRYGFEMVDAENPTIDGLFGVNRKFTPNRMSAIPGKFSSI